MAGPDVVSRAIVQRGGNQRVLTLHQPWILGLDDDQFFLYDGTDETKRARFQLEDIPPDTDVVFRLPGDEGTILVGGVSTQPEGLTFILNGQGSPLATGVAGDLKVLYDCTITSVDALADRVGSLVVDVWASYGAYPPTVAGSIVAAAPITIATNDHHLDESVAGEGWTTQLLAGTYLRFNVVSCSTITRCTIALGVQRLIGE